MQIVLLELLLMIFSFLGKCLKNSTHSFWIKQQWQRIFQMLLRSKIKYEKNYRENMFLFGTDSNMLIQKLH